MYVGNNKMIWNAVWAGLRNMWGRDWGRESERRGEEGRKGRGGRGEGRGGRGEEGEEGEERGSQMGLVRENFYSEWIGVFLVPNLYLKTPKFQLRCLRRTSEQCVRSECPLARENEVLSCCSFSFQLLLFSQGYRLQTFAHRRGWAAVFSFARASLKQSLLQDQQPSC